MPLRVSRPMNVWVFVLILNLPSFGGEVTATVRANGHEACERLRMMITRQFGGEHNLRGSITRCAAAVPQETEPSPGP